MIYRWLQGLVSRYCTRLSGLVLELLKAPVMLVVKARFPHSSKNSHLVARARGNFSSEKTDTTYILRLDWKLDLLQGVARPRSQCNLLVNWGSNPFPGATFSNAICAYFDKRRLL